jgi:hypothetical protein
MKEYAMSRHAIKKDDGLKKEDGMKGERMSKSSPGADFSCRLARKGAGL